LRPAALRDNAWAKEFLKDRKFHAQDLFRIQRLAPGLHFVWLQILLPPRQHERQIMMPPESNQAMMQGNVAEGVKKSITKVQYTNLTSR
jgi:hypothetical protein